MLKRKVVKDEFSQGLFPSMNAQFVRAWLTHIGSYTKRRSLRSVRAALNKSWVTIASMFLMVTISVSAEVSKPRWRADLDQMKELNPLIDEVQGRMVARSFYIGSNVRGGILRLPDGGYIVTDWRAALETSSPDPAVGEPVWPSCEPAIYNLKKVLPDGRVGWERAYIISAPELLKSDSYESCDSDRFGFTVRSPLREIRFPGFYEINYRNRVFVWEDLDTGKSLVIDPSSGEIVGTRLNKKVIAIEPDKLRKLKIEVLKEIDAEVESKKSRKVNESDEEFRRSELFRRVHERLFP